MFINRQEAGKRLSRGEIIAVATETVFGLAADMHSESAILNLYNLKGRDLKKPFVVQPTSLVELFSYLAYIPHDLQKLTDRYFPGPLTLVLPINPKKISPMITGNSPVCGFRLTEYSETKKLIEEFGPLVITSANRSGGGPLDSPEAIEQIFGRDFPVFRGEEEPEGIVSTVVAYVDASWVLLRPGKVSCRELAGALGYLPPAVSFVDFKKGTYRIRPQLLLMDGPYDGFVKTVLGFSDRNYPFAETVFEMGTLKEGVREDEKKLMAALQDIDREEIPYVWVDMNFPKEGNLKRLALLLERASRAGS